MHLDVVIEDNKYRLVIPQDMIDEGGSFFSKMDNDMDRGWMIGHQFVDVLDPQDRCRVAADKMLAALEAENKTLSTLMAAYILVKMPDVTSVDIDTTGEVHNTEFTFRNDIQATVSATPETPKEIMAQVEKDVSRVYKVGKIYKYAVFNPVTKEWVESSPCLTEDEAKDARLQAMNKRYEELAGL